MRKAMVVPAVTAALVLAGAPTAAAAPPERQTFELHCSNRETYTVEVNGNGSFTPGRVVGSTLVVIPVAFGDFLFRAELPDGTVIEDSEAGLVDRKGNGNVLERNPRETTACTFGETLVLEEAEDGFPAGTVLTFMGTVLVHIPTRG